ncbi:DUF859 family phage minor structural protein [Dialister sp.]|uniref:DUF859 family phage minor structural protein n=1 Tax=Dialister sp. TaxID=1955814 RepID=UPI00406D520A
MATSAKNETTCGYNGHYHLYMAIKVNSQNANTNQSNVTVTMYAKSDSSSYGAYNLDASGNTVKMTVNSKQVVSKTMAMDFRNRATVNLGSWTGNISHGADGKKTLACSGSFSISGSSYLSNGSISCSIVLDQIPRATKPTLSASTVALGSAVTIGIAPAVSTWTHNLYYRVGTGSWVRFATGVKSNYAWAVPLAIADNFPSATSGTITIGVNTYNGSTLIGGTQTINLNITIPASVAPSVSSVSVSEREQPIQLFGAGYVQGKSRFLVNSSASGAYGSWITGYRFDVGSQSYTNTSNSYEMQETVRDSGTVTIKVTVTDSRGRTASRSITVSVLPYSVPQITGFDCSRCGDAKGTVNNSGEFLKVYMAFSVSSLNNNNTGKYKLEYCQTGASSWTALTSGDSYSYSGTFISSTALLNSANSYKVRLTVWDSFTSSVIVREVGTAVRLLSYIVKKTAIAIGKIPEKDSTFEVALETVFNRYASFMSGVGIAGDLKAYGNINANRDIGLAGNIWTTNQSKIYSTNVDGKQKVVMVLCDSDNDLSIGYGSWINKDGDTYLRGRDVYLGASSTASYTTYRPYYRRGDSIDVRMGTAGYVTSGTKEFYFTIPLGKPVVGNPSVSVSSINGLIIRQNSKYIIKSDWVQPDRYSAYIRNNNAVSVIAFWNNTTNAENNSPVGIDANIRITFS